jgi:hypothetical protein
MFREGDWVKLAADDPSLDLKAGMLGKVTLVFTTPTSKRTLYIVQPLSDGIGVLTPETANLPVVGEESDFVYASPGEILFATGAEALKNKILPASPPALTAPQAPTSTNPRNPQPSSSSDPAHALVGLLLLGALFGRPKSSETFDINKVLMILAIVVAAILVIAAIAQSAAH